MDISWIFNSTGWMGVALGAGMFGMGWIAGFGFTRGRVTELVIAHTIASMIEDGYIKTKQVYNDTTGKWEEEMLKFDEEL